MGGQAPGGVLEAETGCDAWGWGGAAHGANLRGVQECRSVWAGVAGMCLRWVQHCPEAGGGTLGCRELRSFHLGRRQLAFALPTGLPCLWATPGEVASVSQGRLRRGQQSHYQLTVRARGEGGWLTCPGKIMWTGIQLPQGLSLANMLAAKFRLNNYYITWTSLLYN